MEQCPENSEISKKILTDFRVGNKKNPVRKIFKKVDYFMLIY